MAKGSANSYERSRYEILSYLFSFPISKAESWRGGYNRKFRVGDLVAISCAQASKWYVSWIDEIEEIGSSEHCKYLLRSIEDGSLCWWSNVAMTSFDPETVAKHPEWKWNDRQFEFVDKWHRVCYNDYSAHIILPRQAIFNGDEVTLGLRVRYNMSEFKYEKTFDNYKKVTKKIMGELYEAGVKAEKGK